MFKSRREIENVMTGGVLSGEGGIQVCGETHTVLKDRCDELVCTRCECDCINDVFEHHRCDWLIWRNRPYDDRAIRTAAEEGAACVQARIHTLR